MISHCQHPTRHKTKAAANHPAPPSGSTPLSLLDCEMDYCQHGGILPFVLRQPAAAP